MSISNSGSDERGQYKGGQAGDQTGREWQVRTWYNRPWNCVLRYPNADVRADIAKLATNAANNNNIGYDQSERTTFWNYLTKAANYDPANIKNACEADCSSGVAAIVKAVGYRKGIPALQNVSKDMWTGNMRQGLKNAGFEVLTDSKYLTSDKYLLAGDILLNDAAHVAINLTNGANANANAGSNTSAPSTSNGANLTVDGLWGSNTTKALQKVLGTSQDGIIAAQRPAYFNKVNQGGLLSNSWQTGNSSFSQTIKALQKKIGNTSNDGQFGTYTCKDLQKHLGVTQDGVIGNPSVTVKEMQRRLNAGTF